MQMLEEIYLRLSAVSVYTNVVETPVMRDYMGLLGQLLEETGDKAALLRQYASVCHGLMAQGVESLGDYLVQEMQCGDNPYARAAALGQDGGLLDQLAHQDVMAFNMAASYPCREIQKAVEARTHAPALPAWKDGSGASFEYLTSFYRENGFGVYARSRALSWNGRELQPVLHPDPIDPVQMVGYQWQREAVYANTRALVSGRRVNNVLLYGDSGTGKSATVKSMLQVPAFSTLRIVEVDKYYLKTLPELTEALGELGLHFILFIDDLSFEDGDPNYSALKIILEGGVARRPRNVAIYATSNRRQLVRRNFSDRDDMDREETVQEKTSLADRFGIRIPYMALTRVEFMDLVVELAKAAGLEMETEALKKEALKWEMEHASRTPRTAVQFIDYMVGLEA